VIHGDEQSSVWTSVHNALDARRDPLDDPAVIAALEAAPEMLAEIAALRAGLRALPSSRTAKRMRLLPLALTAAAAALAFMMWPTGQGSAPSEPMTASLTDVSPTAPTPALEAAPPRGRILFASAVTAQASTLIPSPGVLDHHQTVFVTHP